MKLADDEAEVQTLFKIDAEIVGSISSHESDQSAAAASTISNQQVLPAGHPVTYYFIFAVTYLLFRMAKLKICHSSAQLIQAK